MGKDRDIVASANPQLLHFIVEIASDKDVISRYMLQLESWFANSHLTEDQFGPAVIATNEVLSNVSRHAYVGRKNIGMSAKVFLYEEEIRVSIFDKGIPFLPPTNIADPKWHSSQNSELRESGFGWSMILQLAQTIDLKRVNGENQLHMSFRI